MQSYGSEGQAKFNDELVVFFFFVVGVCSSTIIGLINRQSNFVVDVKCQKTKFDSEIISSWKRYETKQNSDNDGLTR
jgi:hypothetical protein